MEANIYTSLITQVANKYSARYNVPSDDLASYLADKFHNFILPRIDQNRGETHIAFVRKSLNSYCINFLRDSSRLLKVARADHDLVQGYATLLKHRPHLANLPIEYATNLLGVTPERFQQAQQAMQQANMLELKAFAKIEPGYELSEAHAYISNEMAILHREMLEARYLDKQSVEQIANEYGMPVAEVQSILDAEVALLSKLVA